MVKKTTKNGQTLFVCQECESAYAEREWAVKCEKWCKEHHTCNIEIIRHAVGT